MNNTYLVEVIKAMKPKERQEIAQLLAISMFNDGANAKQLQQLYQLVLDAAPDFSEAALEKEKLCALVMGGGNNQAVKFEKLIGELNRFIRAQLLSKRYLSETNEDQQQLDWLAWMRERGMVERARYQLTKLKNQKENEKLESLAHYRALFLLAEEEHEWELLQNQFKSDLIIPRLLYSFQEYVVNYQKELENRYLLQQKGEQLPDLQPALNDFARSQKETALPQILQSINGLLKKQLPTTQDFQQLLQLLRNHESVLPMDTLAEFLTYLRNACTLLINAGHLELTPFLHEIHKDNLERGLFYVQKLISPNVYINLVQIAIRVKEYHWAREVTEKYKGKLIGGDKGRFFYRFNMAHCLFAEGEHEKALDLIPDVASSSHYHRTVRRLEIKIYYELRSELLLYKMDAFRKFIVRTATKTIAANLRTMDINFLNILTQITQLRPKDTERANRLLSRIDKKELLSDRAWLIEKVKGI